MYTICKIKLFLIVCALAYAADSFCMNKQSKRETARVAKALSKQPSKPMGKKAAAQTTIEAKTKSEALPEESAKHSVLVERLTATDPKKIEFLNEAIKRIDKHLSDNPKTLHPAIFRLEAFNKFALLIVNDENREQMYADLDADINNKLIGHNRFFSDIQSRTLESSQESKLEKAKKNGIDKILDEREIRDHNIKLGLYDCAKFVIMNKDKDIRIRVRARKIADMHTALSNHIKNNPPKSDHAKQPKEKAEDIEPKVDILNITDPIKIAFLNEALKRIDTCIRDNATVEHPAVFKLDTFHKLALIKLNPNNVKQLYEDLDKTIIEKLDYHKKFCAKIKAIKLPASLSKKLAASKQEVDRILSEVTFDDALINNGVYEFAKIFLNRDKYAHQFLMRIRGKANKMVDAHRGILNVKKQASKLTAISDLPTQTASLVGVACASVAASESVSNNTRIATVNFDGKANSENEPPTITAKVSLATCAKAVEPTANTAAPDFSLDAVFAHDYKIYLSRHEDDADTKKAVEEWAQKVVQVKSQSAELHEKLYQTTKRNLANDIERLVKQNAQALKRQFVMQVCTYMDNAFFLNPHLQIHEPQSVRTLLVDDAEKMGSIINKQNFAQSFALFQKTIQDKIDLARAEFVRLQELAAQEERDRVAAAQTNLLQTAAAAPQMSPNQTYPHQPLMPYMNVAPLFTAASVPHNPPSFASQPTLNPVIPSLHPILFANSAQISAASAGHWQNGVVYPLPVPPIFPPFILPGQLPPSNTVPIQLGSMPIFPAVPFDPQFAPFGQPHMVAAPNHTGQLPLGSMPFAALPTGPQFVPFGQTHMVAAPHPTGHLPNSDG